VTRCSATRAGDDDLDATGIPADLAGARPVPSPKRRTGNMVVRPRTFRRPRLGSLPSAALQACIALVSSSAILACQQPVEHVDPVEPVERMAGLTLPLDVPALGSRLLREERWEVRVGAPGPDFHAKSSTSAEVEVFASNPRRITAAKLRVLYHHMEIRTADGLREPAPLVPGHAYVVSRADGEGAQGYDVDGHPMTDEMLERLVEAAPLDEGFLRTALEGRELVVGQPIRHPTDIELTQRRQDGLHVERYRDVEVVLTDVSGGIAHLEVSLTVESTRPDGGSSTWKPSGWIEVGTKGDGYLLEHLAGPIELRTGRGLTGRGTAREDSKQQLASKRG
jgi:hypothetical protein